MFVSRSSVMLRAVWTPRLVDSSRAGKNSREYRAYCVSLPTSGGHQQTSRDGCPSALARFEETVLPHLDAAYTLARCLLRNDHDAEDVVQDAYLRAVRHFGGYRGGNTRAWLLTIERHTCYRWLRRHKADARAIESVETLNGEVQMGDDPEAELHRGTLDEALKQAMPKGSP